MPAGEGERAHVHGRAQRALGRVRVLEGPQQDEALGEGAELGLPVPHCQHVPAPRVPRQARHVAAAGGVAGERPEQLQLGAVLPGQRAQPRRAALAARALLARAVTRVAVLPAARPGPRPRPGTGTGTQVARGSQRSGPRRAGQDAWHACHHAGQAHAQHARAAAVRLARRRLRLPRRRLLLGGRPCVEAAHGEVRGARIGEAAVEQLPGWVGG